jgi:hypothetical protein
MLLRYYLEGAHETSQFMFYHENLAEVPFTQSLPLYEIVKAE